MHSRFPRLKPVPAPQDPRLPAPRSGEDFHRLSFELEWLSKQILIFVCSSQY